MEDQSSEVQAPTTPSNSRTPSGQAPSRFSAGADLVLWRKRFELYARQAKIADDQWTAKVETMAVGKEDDSESESEAVAAITNATRPSSLATQVEQLAVGSCLSVDGRLGKLVVKILIDTGSAVTLVREDVWKKVQQSPKTIKAPVHSVVAANGEKLELVGQGSGAVLLEPLDTFMEDHGLLVARSLSQVSCNHLVVQVLNPGPAPVVVNKDVRVGVIKPVTESDIVCSIESTKSNRHVGHSECAHLIELMLQNTEHLSSYHKSQGVALLQEFQDVIAKSDDDDLGQTSLSFHTIDTDWR
ncbi:hypothetical protein EMCRGX_G012962 [Ephydatia muelleri]